MKYSSIAISGQIASGTSTAGKALAQQLGLKYESAGDFFRKYALENNIPLHDKELIPDDLDKDVDQELTKLAQNGGYIIDAHYIGYFTKDAPSVLKVLLTCDEQERIKRALAREHTHKENAEEVKLREQGLDKKFRRIYADENYLDPKFFNLTIDTTNTQPEDVVKKIINRFMGQ
ncbi:MAG TPA: cytidylate kinase family protein [Candidatus Saccharimonadales bacterium]|nr:cytidylate kinase family protein [Candidatus Saccharimonadales bacterium]